MTTQTTADARIDRPTDDVVLFDMDGVILEGHGTDSIVHSRALDDVLQAREMEIEDDLRPALETYEYTDAFVSACETLEVDPAAFYTEREHRSVKRSVERLAAGSRGLCPDADALDRLSDHVTIGLVSNNYDPTVEFVVDHFRLDAFDFVRGRDLGPDGFHRRKPEPHYLNEALDALDATGGYYVGDRETDVIAAENAGLDPVFIRRDHNAETALDVEPTVEIGSLKELLSLVADPSP
ncbi:HAD family hydrolase [Halorubrum sp. DTA46]|uniref:HAD family hydrolase n=1 Tax=Halorubrum sp. DTA46 TaxID=3402162 RepID=UPI003AAF0B61